MILILTDRLGALDTDALGGLGSLGVTNVTLLEDASMVGVLVQGWAFETSSARDAVEMLASGESDVRVLRPVMQVSVSPQEVAYARREDAGTPEKEKR
ncbi:MAG: hypothetical protein KY394_06075 [Actinobacteria bacterium]|nr:hypothetical protein [Actinomycetota bacterium]